MDIVYHRNCLDGVFSAYLMYLFAKSLPSKIYQHFVEHLSKKGQSKLQNFTINNEEQLFQYPKITQEFFHEPIPQISFSSVSMYAGEFYPVAPSKKNNILIIVDISPTDKQSILKISELFKQIIIIEHHSSFSKTQSILSQLKLPNVHYIWQEGICAAQLTLSFLNKSFGFLRNFPKQFVDPLLREIQYVGKNDLKKNEDRISKQFVLGFYYFQVQMSHMNPYLFKRLWSMKLDTILDKGKNLLSNHFAKLKEGVENLEVWRCEKGNLKGLKFFGAQLRDRGIISDLGSILAYLSTDIGNQNLAIIYHKPNEFYKISARSSLHASKQPLALQVAKTYGGGGHVCAAGCSIPRNVFLSNFTNLGRLNPKISLKEKQIEKILFYDSLQ